MVVVEEEKEALDKRLLQMAYAYKLHATAGCNLWSCSS